MNRFALVALLGIGVLGCATAEPVYDAGPSSEAMQTNVAAPTSDVAPRSAAAIAAVDASDRGALDSQLDSGRRPAELLTFAGVAEGMRVAELGAGGGYTTELLARMVGPAGVVYGHNDPFVLERFAAEPWSERLQKPSMANVVRLDRPFDDPFPAEVSGLDSVIIVLFYHDTVWLNADRDRMNRAVFAALRPGGTYTVVDHSSWPGRGTSEAQTLHRIEEKLVRTEIERAGFVLADQAFFLRSSEDTRDWSASPRDAGERRGTTDRFVLKFVKPATAAGTPPPAQAVESMPGAAEVAPLPTETPTVETAPAASEAEIAPEAPLAPTEQTAPASPEEIAPEAPLAPTEPTAPASPEPTGEVAPEASPELEPIGEVAPEAPVTPGMETVPAAPEKAPAIEVAPEAAPAPALPAAPPATEAPRDELPRLRPRRP